MPARLTETRRALLVAMASRGTPAVRGFHRWFVPTWGGPVEEKDIEALISLGHLVRRPGSGRVVALTPSGRAVAESTREKEATE